MQDLMELILEEQMAQTTAEVEAALSRLLTPDGVSKQVLGRMYDSMRYSTLGGGKRVRPFLVTSFASLFAKDCNRVRALQSALTFACALEMIHCYSLIHDDLPCMDDDDLRRGKPSNHKVFGEAGAVLAGDGLLTLAFETVASVSLLPASVTLRAVKVLAQCAGPEGMVGGQSLDLENSGKPMNEVLLDEINQRKTGALISAACQLGALAAEADESSLLAAQTYANGIGRSFQLIDDILDVIGHPEVLGKNAGVDAQNGKTTYATIFGVARCRELAQTFTDTAVAAIAPYEEKELLTAFAYYLLNRTT